MSDFLSVTMDTAAFEAALATLARPRLDRPVALALADTAKNARVKAASLIAKRTGLKSAVVRPRILADFVPVGAYVTHVRASRKPIELIDFRSTRQNSVGISTRAWGRPVTIRGGFIATMPTGHRGAYIRTSRSRLPITKLWGPTIAGTFQTPEVAAVIKATIRVRLAFNLARRITSEMRRRA